MDLSFYADASGTHNVEVASQGSGGLPLDLRFLSSATASLTSDSSAISRWSLTALTTTPHLDRVTSERLIDLYAYRPLDMTAMVAFDRRISEPYARLCAENGEFYAGPFACSALGDDWIVEVATYNFDDPAQVERMLDDAVETPELLAIMDECRLLQNRESTRYSVRLIPKAH